MPLDEALGCLGTLLSGLLRLIDFLLELGHVGETLGWLASWTIRLLTFGRYKPDPESRIMILLGFVIFVTLVIVAGIWGDW